MSVKDLVIVGAGPAGITAAVYAVRKKLDLTVVSRDIGGQAAWSGEVENYTGYQLVTGPELAMKFREHLAKFDFDLREGEVVKQVVREDKHFIVELENGEKLESRTIIIASGKRPRLLGVPGEAKYKNKGLFFCATCDAPLLQGKAVAVIGGGNSALDAALQLDRIASRIYLINLTDQLTGDPVLQEKISNSSKVTTYNQTKVIAVCGDQFVKSLKIERDGQSEELAVEGVFVEIGLVPNSGMINLVEKNDQGEILINCATETSVPGIFAAGDVTNVVDKQIIIAAGEGAKAALAAFRYLSRC